MTDHTDEILRVATPPRMVCQNCGLGIFNTLTLGRHFVHTVTGKAECKRGRSRQARARRAAKSAVTSATGVTT